MKARTMQPLLLAVAVMIITGTAFADEHSVFDMTLEELLGLKVTVASQRDEIVREAPAVMTIVTRQEIEALGARNLIDVINRLPGMQVVGWVGFYGNRVQIRAQSSSSQDRHTLILLNGRPVRENVNGGNNAYFYLGFPLSSIESIEIIRGPGSVLYGSNAFAAVINIKTRRVDDGKEVTEASVTYGTYDTRDFDALIVGQTDGLMDVLAALRISRSDGPNITWTDQVGTTGTQQYSDDSDSIYVSIGNDKYRLQTAYHRYTPGDYGILGRLADAVYISEVETFFGDLGAAYDVTDNLSAHLNLTLNTFSWEGSDDGITFFQRRRSRNLIVEPSFHYSPMRELNIVLGGTLEYDKFAGRELFEHSRYIHSLYAQADYQLADWLKTVAGLQYNKVEEIEANYSPRIGLVMTPGDTWGAKLLYSEAFRRAYAVEERLNSSFLLGNTSLDPETMKTYEAQINYQSPVCQVDLTYFHSQQDVIEVDPTTRPLRFINHAGDITTEGVEMTARFALGAHWQGMGSTIIQSTDNDTGFANVEPDYPDYMVKGGVMGYYEKINIGLFNAYYSDVKNRHGAMNNLQANLSFDVSRILHLATDGIKLSVYGDNLLDEKLFRNSQISGNEDVFPHSYGRRVYATVGVRW